MDEGRFVLLDGMWDPHTVLKNPHKGWYFHYYDNTLKGYWEDRDDLLTDFPGLNHVYLRLDWNDLEPQEGRFRWEVIDEVLEKWTAAGYGAAFRVCCKETSADQTFSTPQWVMDAGAKGAFYPSEDGKGRNWEPDYGDPVFLDKLEAFHAAFAARYDGQPWLEYVDVGSYGEWGEGHTGFSSHKTWPVETLLKHFDIHDRQYKKSLVMGNYSFVVSRPAQQEAERRRIWDEMIARGWGLRCDSVCVGYYHRQFPMSTLHHPELYGPFWRRVPVDLELEHYRSVLKNDSWNNGYSLLAAAYEAHPTFGGFHGPARRWLADHGEYARMLANVLGYWYFPSSARVPEAFARGGEAKVTVHWQNRGVAPAYRQYDVRFQLTGPGGACVLPAAGGDNRAWLPGLMVGEEYALTVPSDLPAGEYALALGLFDGDRPILLGLKTDAVPYEDGFYRLPATVRVE